MARLRRTLPGDFKELVAAGDAGKIKAALKKCEPDAYENNSRRKTALMNPDLPEEIVRWLVTEYGADVNYADRYGYTPLSEAAVRRPERIDLLLSLGAQINFRKDEQSPTALMAAATSYSVAGVRRLAERGANLRLGRMQHFFHPIAPVAFSAFVFVFCIPFALVSPFSFLHFFRDFLFSHFFSFSFS